MGVINWDKPKKLRSTEQHNEMYSNETGAVYVPNMSKEDQEIWKGKLINGGKDTARVELRKTFRGINNCYSQVLLIVTNEDVTMSMNGKTAMSIRDWCEMHTVVNEAIYKIHGVDL